MNYVCSDTEVHNEEDFRLLICFYELFDLLNTRSIAIVLTK